MWLRGWWWVSLGSALVGSVHGPRRSRRTQTRLPAFVSSIRYKTTLLLHNIIPLLHLCRLFVHSGACLNSHCFDYIALSSFQLRHMFANLLVRCWSSRILFRYTIARRSSRSHHVSSKDFNISLVPESSKIPNLSFDARTHSRFPRPRRVMCLSDTLVSA